MRESFCLLGHEASAEREVQVDALHEALGLYAQQRGARGVQRQALLLHRAQVAGADAEAHVRKLERARVAGHRLAQDDLTPVQRKGAGQRIFDLAEGARADARILRKRLLLLRGADLDLRLQLPAEEERRGERGTGAPHRDVTVLEDEELARDAGHPRGERDARQARGLCFLHAVERCGDASLGGDDVGAALEQLRRHADRHGIRQRRELRRDAERCGGIAAGKHLQRAQRLLVGEVEAVHAVAESGEVRARERHVVLVAAADAQAVLREAELALGGGRHFLAFAFCSRASLARNQLLATMAASDWRAYSASSALESYCPRAAARPARTRPQRSSSQLAKMPAPSRPLESPESAPPPRASALTCG